MTKSTHGGGTGAGGTDARRTEPARPTAGEGGMVMLGLTVGVLFMSVQLWLLTLAFNLYLSGERRGTLIGAIVSGGIFVGGLVMLRLLHGPTHRGAPDATRSRR